MTVNHLLRGPDTERVYAIRHDRWSVTSEESNADLMVALKPKLGMTRQEVSTIILLTMFFWTLCFTVYVYADGMLSFLIAFMIAGAVPAFAIFVLNAIEEDECKKRPQNILVINKQKCTINDIDYDYSILTNALLRYRIHVPTSEWSGSESVSSHSELDLIIDHGKTTEATHCLIACKDDSCLKPAKRLSSLTGIPLRQDRIAR